MESLLPLLFYAFCAVMVYFSYKVISSPNPIHCALYLVMTMLCMAALYFHLNAQFIAGVQLIVYAGAVMVLFVMVLMLFDLQQEIRAFSKGLFSGALKVMSAALLAGYLIGTFQEAGGGHDPAEAMATLNPAAPITRQIAGLLYSKYLVAFEILGVLLLVVAVGVVVISRVKGGTHAKH